MGKGATMDAKGMGSLISGTKGSTLIELLMVVIIVGLLAAIAIPIYRVNIKKVASSEGAALLGTILTAQKVHYSEHNIYTSDENVLMIDLAGNKYFRDFEITHADADGFTAKTSGTSICDGIEVTMVYTNIAGATISYSGF